MLTSPKLMVPDQNGLTLLPLLISSSVFVFFLGSAFLLFQRRDTASERTLERLRFVLALDCSQARFVSLCLLIDEIQHSSPVLVSVVGGVELALYRLDELLCQL